jgi:LCP family protein required for cell wall assembly
MANDDRGDHSHRGVGRRRRRTPRRTSFSIVARVIGAALSCALLAGFGYGWYQYRSLDSGLQRLHLNSLGQAPTARSGAPKSPVNGQDQNILVVGLDSRDGLTTQEQRMLKVGSANSLATDTIMVIHVPADGSRATMISIPRDSFVDIPGYAKNKINAAYADAYTNAVDQQGATHKEAEAAGADLLVETVSTLTGLRIDHYIQVGFGGFYTIAKALHSIPVNLCAATNDSISRNIAEGNGPVGSGFRMSAGKHDLTPVQALEFVRQRHNIVGGDLAREKRQRYFISAAFNKIASAGVLLNPSKLNSLIKAVTGAFYVDDNGFSLVDLANQMADLSASKITGYTIPTNGTANVQVVGQTVNVVQVDPTKVQRFVQQRLSSPTGKSSSGASTSPKTPATPKSTAGSSAAAPTTSGCIN